MQLSPKEKDKLLISMAAEVARKRLLRGVKLNQRSKKCILVIRRLMIGERHLSQ